VPIESLVLGCIAMLVPLGLGVLTGLGSHRRGAPPAVRVVSAALFPVTWVVWYVKDNLLDR
jgi:hypothetical protein